MTKRVSRATAVISVIGLGLGFGCRSKTAAQSVDAAPTDASALDAGIVHPERHDAPVDGRALAMKCAAVRAGETDAGGAAARSSKYAAYPYSEIGRVYDTALDNVLRHYFEKHPALNEQQRGELRDFIVTSSRNSFIRLHTTLLDAEAKFDRAMGDAAYRNSKAFRNDLAGDVALSKHFVVGHIYLRIRVYEREVLDPDLTMELFALENGCEHDELIAFVQSELDTVPASSPQPGDHVYAFSVPSGFHDLYAMDWGWLVVRGNRIVEVPTGPLH